MDNKMVILFEEIQKLHAKYESSLHITPDFYDPGNMEYLDKYFGSYNENTGEILLRFEVKGTRYEGRTELIESVNIGDKIKVVRDEDNEYNSNNFTFFTLKNRNLGHMPAELCNAIAPLYDEGDFVLEKSVVSYVEPISKRSRYAKQAILFVEITGRLI